MGRKRAAELRTASCASAPTRRKAPALPDRIHTASVAQATQATATQVAYARYITSARGRVPWASAQDVPSSGLSADTATRVAEYYYYRTHGFNHWLQLSGQVTAAIAYHFTATTDCGTGRWVVLSRDGEAFTSGHPAPSAAIDDIQKAHKKALAREGKTGSDSVDVLEPVHVRAFFRAHL